MPVRCEASKGILFSDLRYIVEDCGATVLFASPETVEAAAHGQVGVLALAVDPPADPVAVVELRDLLTRTLAPASPRDCKSSALREQGWSPAEIAQMLGIDRNTLALLFRPGRAGLG